jgi:hypothetical protein
VSLDLLRRDYEATINELAAALGLDYEELVGFCGSIENGCHGIRRLKEFFTAPEITDLLDRLVDLSNQYRKKVLPT